MREILFRGKTKENGEWVQGYFVYAKSDFDSEEYREADIIPHDTDRVYKGEYNVVFPCVPETIGQFTGLTDKNGTKIFEGDIVKYKYISNFAEDEELEEVGREKPDEVIESIRDVKWNEKSGCFFPLPERNDCEDCWYSYGIYDFEVIGNIHDNLELLRTPQNDEVRE